MAGCDFFHVLEGVGDPLVQTFLLGPKCLLNTL